jgi:hypothetical protein
MQGNIRSAPLAAPLAPVTTWAQGDGGD